VIRSKNDYAVMVFADSRYALADKREKLPTWIRQDMRSEYSNLDTEVAAALVRRFVREMGQPWDISTKIGTELWDVSHVPQE
jgi:DNA excision repair protein ERCC-2